MRAIAILVLAGGALAACVSGLPGGTLGEPTGASGGTGGIGGAGGSPPPPPPPPGTDAAAIDAPVGPGTGGAGGRATGGVGGIGSLPDAGVPERPAPFPGCAPPLAEQPITSFAESSGSNPIRFGTPLGITGQTFARTLAGASPPIVSIAPGDDGTNALQIAGDAGATPLFDGGLRFDTYVNVSAYTHVRFTIHFLTTCAVGFAVLSPPSVSPADDPRGSCPFPSCPLPFTSVTQSGTVCAPIMAMIPLVDPTSVIGLDWQGQATCAFTIDDVALVRQ
jgi:hypothetical protein